MLSEASLWLSARLFKMLKCFVGSSFIGGRHIKPEILKLWILLQTYSRDYAPLPPAPQNQEATRPRGYEATGLEPPLEALVGASWWPPGDYRRGGQIALMQCSNVESRTPCHISSYQGLNVLEHLKTIGYEATIYIYSMLLRRQSSQPGGTPHKEGPAD